MELKPHNTILAGDCRNCLNSVKLEFAFQEGEIYSFVCRNCGIYNHLTKKETAQLIDNNKPNEVNT